MLKKIITILLFAITSLHLPAADFTWSANDNCGRRLSATNYYVIFINGIRNTRSQACASSEKLIDTLKFEGIATKNINFDYFYNPKGWGGGASDFLELQPQAYWSAQAVKNVEKAGYNSDGNQKKYYSELGRLYKDLVTRSENKNHPIYATTKSMYENIKNLTQSYYGAKIVLVAHSQGNFFVEAVYGMLINDVENGDLQAIKTLNRIRVVGVGVVSRTSPHYRWISSTQDKALLGMDNLYITGSAFSIILKNNIPCLVNTNDCSIAWGNYGDLTGHGFNEVYLSPTIYGQGNNKIFSKNIAEMIQKSLIDLGKPIKKINNVEILTYYAKNKKNGTSYANLPLKILGISNAIAQTTLGLFWYVNQDYTIKVSGSDFDGSEDIEIAGSTCLASSIQRFNGYFTKKCTSGGISGDTNKVRVYDVQYDLDIESPPEYQTMSLRGPILAPNAPTLADLGSGSVSVTWGAVAGVTSYEVYRGVTLARTVAATTLTITDTGLMAGVSSCYTIRAIANGAASQSSSGACITPVAPVQKCAGLWTTGQYNVGQTEQQTQACSAGYTGNKILTHTCQAGLAGSNVGAWSAATTQDNCVIVAPATCLGTWSSTRYNVGQVEEQFANTCPAGSQGQVRTFHTCQAGGSWSANAQSDTCVATLVTPTGLSASSVSAAQNGVAGIRLVWTAVSGATRYYITRNGSSNYSSQVGTNWTDPNATAGVQYCYTVNAFSSLNNARSPESSQVCAVYQPTQVSVSPPTNLAAARYTTGGRKDILLTWTPPSPVPDSYQVFRRDRSGMLAPLGGSDASFIDRYELNLTSGISYCYFIRAEKGGVISTESNEACSLAP